MENKIKILDDISHVLLRPNMYIGAITHEENEGFVFNKNINKFEYKKYNYVQGFFKLLDEIISNCCDEFLRTEGKFANIVDITIEDNRKIIIKDNGRGVPITSIIDEKGKKISQLEAAFTKLRSGSNFNNDDRQTIGMNGYGASLVAVFSKEFQVKVNSEDGTGILYCKNNLQNHKCKIDLIPNSHKTYTEVSFIPDYDRFGLRNFDEIHQKLLYTRLLNLSICYPKIKFKFNGQLLSKLKPELYLSYFGNDFEQIKENSKYIIGIFPNNVDNFIHSSHVNGLNIKDGGNYIDFILNEIISRLRNHKVFKKYNVTPGDIKNKLQLVCILKDFPNMQFDSQTKEKLTNSNSEVKKYFEDIDFDSFVNNLVKNEKIIDPIIINYKIKEQVKEQLVLKNAIKIEKHFKCDKYLPATKLKKYLFITEGDSAAGGLAPSIGRTYSSFFSTKGVPLNAYIATPKELASNEELTNIIKVLQLNIANNNRQVLTHEYIVLAEDADADGAHIRGLYISFFLRYAKWMFENNMIKYLKTPIAAILENKKIVKYWFTLSEMNEYLNKHKIKSNQMLKYFKGLGSWRADMLSDLINNNGGLENFLENIIIDDESISILDNWIGNKQENIQARKEYLKDYQLDINKI